MSDFPEADWKVLRQLSKLALERFCKQVMEEAAPLVAGSEASASKGYHERYLALFELLHRRDGQLGCMFNDIKRSTAFMQLAHMLHHQLLTEEEFMTFTQGTRGHVQAFLELE